MNVYLHDIPFDKARSIFHEKIAESGWGNPPETEMIHVDEFAAGRTLAETCWAKISSPHYHASAMDGFALTSATIRDASPANPVSLICGDTAFYVDTGDPIPDWADVVIPIEEVEPVGQNEEPSEDPRKPVRIRVRASAAPWSHIRPMGEDMVATQLVLAKGQVLTAYDLGALAASGNPQIKVVRKPRVGILPTGSELIPPSNQAGKGEIIEFNSMMLAAQIIQWGGEAHRHPIVRDDPESLCEAVQRMADENDLVLLNAGSSAGAEDFSSRVIAELGTVLVHGIAIRPGHPVILGMVRRSEKTEDEPINEIPIIGVPGYPVSAALTGELFVEPLIARWLGRNPSEKDVVEAILTRKVTSPAGDDDYLRVVAGRVGGKMLAAPLPRGAGVISSLSRADGLLKIPAGIQGLEAGETVRVNLYRSRNELERTIFMIGSHDMTLDLLAQALNAQNRRLVSSNVGSLGGMVALRRGEAHLAGSHLLDPESGGFNIRYLPEYLPGVRVKLITWAGRSQGLLVCKGNPKKISGIEDLTRADLTFINRQRGSGTRVLLDYHLKKLGIESASIRGYPQEEYTHLGVAVAVLSGRADCGLGVAAAATALDLEFIPLFMERYDLIIPQEHAENPLLLPVFELMHDQRFIQSVARIPGYDVSSMGNVVGEYG
jgi:putative molybdopterin biosynthesis protein